MLFLPDIINNLESLKVPFSAHGTVVDVGFTPASLSNVIKNGIYFDSGNSVSGSSLHNSILFAASLRDTGNSLLVVTKSPQLAYYKLLEAAFPRNASAQIHPTAIIDPAAMIHPSASIGPYCIIEKSVISAGARLHSSVTVMKNCIVGENTEIEPNTVIGATGAVWCWDAAENRRVSPPQMGHVAIGRDCFIGSNVSIVRGSINEATFIENNVVMSHGTKVGHGCRIGKESHLANNVTLGGSVTIGARSFLGSGCVLRPGISLPEKTTVGCGAVVTSDFQDKGLVLTGVPARPMNSTKPDRLSGMPDVRGM